MYKYLLIILFALFIGCSSNTTQKNYIAGDNSLINQPNKKRAAKEKFINGSIYETKGQFAEAITEYMEALKYDPQPGIYYTIAKNFFRLNRLNLALQNAKKAVELEPENIEYMYLLAAVYNSSRLEDSSITVYEKIISVDSTNTTAIFQLAQLYEKNRPSYSLLLYKKLVDLIGPEWSVLVRIADLNERQGNINETIRTLEELIKLNPTQLELKRLLAETYLKIKEYDKAIEVADEALISYPDDIGLIEQKANAYIQKENWKEAAEEYRKLFNSDKINYETKLRISSIFMVASEVDPSNFETAKSFLKDLAKDSSDWQVNAYLGEIAVRQNEDSLAIKYFEKATELAEWNSQLWVRLGGLLFDKRKYVDAVTYLEKAVGKFPNDFVINLIYGLSLSQLNDHKEAKIYLERSVNINPMDITALTSYAYTLNQLKETEQALKLFHKALSIHPDDVQILSMTALVYDQQKNFIMFDSLYTKALSIEPDNALVLNNFAYSLSERKIRLEEALKMSQHAVEQEPENSSYLDTIGWIYYQLGEYEKAKKYIELSLEYDNDNAVVIDHLGDVYFKLGLKEKAIELWKKAFELEPDKNEIEEKIIKGEV